jgi:hypothetical protein
MKEFVISFLLFHSVTQRLPSVPYLTSLDKYAIGSLLCLVLFCVWHSLIGSSVITSDAKTRKEVDSYVLYGSAAFYLVYNLFYIVWFMKMFRAITKFHSKNRKDSEIKSLSSSNNSTLNKDTIRRDEKPLILGKNQVSNINTDKQQPPLANTNASTNAPSKAANWSGNINEVDKQDHHHQQQQQQAKFQQSPSNPNKSMTPVNKSILRTDNNPNPNSYNTNMSPKSRTNPHMPGNDAALLMTTA